HLLKVADTNKDGKISKEEFTARQDALFAEIDKDKDGSITPKEMREYRQAKMEAFRAAHPRPEG
ncbi:EF-hand domain-containing protein, partial [Rhizobium sp. BR5]